MGLVDDCSRFISILLHRSEVGSECITCCDLQHHGDALNPSPSPS